MTIDQDHFLWIVLALCAILLAGWVYFWHVIARQKESPTQVLAGTAFLQNLTVIGVICGSCLLALTGIIKGEVEATLLTGIVGYVLGGMRAGASKIFERSSAGPEPPRVIENQSAPL